MQVFVKTVVLFPAADSIPRLTAPVLGFFGNNSARTFSHHDPFLGWAVGAMAHTLVYACSVRACRTAADVLSSVCLRSLPLCPILLQPRLINRWLAAALADYSVRPLLPAPCLLSVVPCQRAVVEAEASCAHNSRTHAPTHGLAQVLLAAGRPGRPREPSSVLQL